MLVCVRMRDRSIEIDESDLIQFSLDMVASTHVQRIKSSSWGCRRRSQQAVATITCRTDHRRTGHCASLGNCGDVRMVLVSMWSGSHPRHSCPVYDYIPLRRRGPRRSSRWKEFL